MAATILARTDLTDVERLARKIADEEGIGIKLARVLAELQYDELAAYAQDWNRSAQTQKEATTRRAVCPVCEEPIIGRQYYVGGRGYVYFDVCSGDGSHFSREA
jgi:hypothetical protein